MNACVDTRPAFAIPSVPVFGTSTAPPAIIQPLQDVRLETANELLRKAISDLTAHQAAFKVIVDSVKTQWNMGAVGEASSIRNVIEKWLDATAFFSSLDEARRDPNYAVLKRLGWAAVPGLLARIADGRARLQCAELLADITGADPLTDADLGHAKRIGDAWMRWGRSRGLT